MDWKKERNMKFTFANEATGKFCGLRIVYRCPVVFSCSHVPVPVPEPATGSPTLLVLGQRCLSPPTVAGRDKYRHHGNVFKYALCSSPIIVSQVLTVSTSFGKSSLTSLLHIPTLS